MWFTVLVTVVSFEPDVWIWRLGQVPQGVLVLALMHVTVAAVTYPALVVIAPQRAKTRLHRAVAAGRVQIKD
ncbi:hypothetical protein GCM10027414_29280 [Humibacter ginsengiterrae]